MPSTASTARSSSAKVSLSSPRRSRPYEFTFWPSSVTSRTPSPARRSTSASSSPGGRLTSRPRVDGHDAVRADAVASLRDLQPGLELPRPLHRQVPGEPLELEVALRADRVGRQELRQAVDLARAEGDVDEREALEDLVLDRLRPAAADADHPRRVLGLEALRLPEVREEAAVGRLADRAGVEQDQVGAVTLRRLLVAERLEHAAHALRVVLVHLAPEGGDVVAPRPHLWAVYRAATRLSACLPSPPRGGRGSSRSRRTRPPRARRSPRPSRRR